MRDQHVKLWRQETGQKKNSKSSALYFQKPSANFIFVSHPEYDAKELFEAMKSKGIYVRFWGSERIEQYLRVTIGTREEMEALFAFLREYMM